ncbi:MAG: hypothetical protein HQK78_15985 [Desulfobacterales bacterium]|nr:hypothetical protein [Desulfobacterales bacterium]
MKKTFKFIILILLIYGCGKKDLPVPPLQIQVQKVTDLKGSLYGDILKIEWTIPDKKIKGFMIYKSKNPINIPKCDTCPLTFQRIAFIPILYSSTNRMSFSEKIEKGYNMIYKVIVVSEKGDLSEDSNYITFSF